MISDNLIHRFQKTAFVLAVVIVGLVPNSQARYVGSGILVEEIINGSTYKISSFLDGKALTVFENGNVSVEQWTGKEEQRWTIFHNPDKFTVQFNNKVVPYNDISGYEDPEDNRGIKPRPLILSKFRIMQQLKDLLSSTSYNWDLLDLQTLPPIPWEIITRNYSCVMGNGEGNPLVVANCEIFDPSPGQYWRFELLSSSSTRISSM